ncbi:HAD family hydrolase [Pseudomonas alliivorans]|uniref:HAD family hydrolase n=1 Tax=Pseudomonas alliivorans TaxID=2810613 RepID=UPI001AE830C6|nr:HAD family hydrolase [Pseudomonas alliivorans]MBP0941009.1 HAD family hydrolase [Pseudomonas alliivorans]MEE4879979.1 HAD family hydrolase [Pseudomonas alliivorans]MEE4930873.1 HAD family hydrolase [Pseudomonas alliivorans]MEE4936147.1 HAD family hydrolase [Pseudomonas alliivorans]MEE4940701.1 HAD family hydrolase [Pseudomonas alliivorans]
MSANFILFDAFGTLLRIPNSTHSYRQILREGQRQGRKVQANDVHQIMPRHLDLAQTAEHFGIKISPDRLAEIESDLKAELDSIEAYDDGLRAVEVLQAEGIRVAVASNLAAPYANPVRHHYPTMDAYCFSFAVGALNPQPFLYRATCELLGVEDTSTLAGNAVMMIGDSEKCDRIGPRAVGIQGFLLNRNGGQDFANLIEFAEQVLAYNQR